MCPIWVYYFVILESLEDQCNQEEELRRYKLFYVTCYRHTNKGMRREKRLRKSKIKLIMN